jgi:hypothetical protein
MRRDARNQAAGTSSCRLSYQIPEQVSNEMSISGILVAVVVLLEGAYRVKLQMVKFSSQSLRQIEPHQVVRKIRRRVSLRVAAVIDPLKAFYCAALSKIIVDRIR